MRLLQAIVEANHRAVAGDAKAGVHPAEYADSLPLVGVTCIDPRLNGLPARGLLMASGWRGQYIVTIPEKQLVITMTACFLDGKESEFFIKLINEYILRSVNGAQNKGGFIKLKTALTQALKSTSVNLQAIEARMVPSVKPLENTEHHFFPAFKK